MLVAVVRLVLFVTIPCRTGDVADIAVVASLAGLVLSVSSDSFGAFVSFCGVTITPFPIPDVPDPGRSVGRGDKRSIL